MHTASRIPQFSITTKGPLMSQNRKTLSISRGRLTFLTLTIPFSLFCSFHHSGWRLTPKAPGSEHPCGSTVRYEGPSHQRHELHSIFLHAKALCKDQRDGAHTTNCEVVKYLLETCLVDDLIAERHGMILTFLQPSSGNLIGYAEVVWSMACGCD